MKAFLGLCLTAICLVGCQKSAEKATDNSALEQKVANLEREVKGLRREVAFLKEGRGRSFHGLANRETASGQSSAERMKDRHQQRMELHRQQLEARRRAFEERHPRRNHERKMVNGSVPTGGVSSVSSVPRTPVK